MPDKSTYYSPYFDNTQKYIELGYNIAYYRKRAGLTQEQLADAVGVTRQTIGLIEAGNYNPSITLCIEICQALHRTLDELFWPEDAAGKS